MIGNKMRIEQTHIAGLFLIQLQKFKDNRGEFIKVFNHDFFANNNLETKLLESYYSISAKNVIRGMHFQIPPYDHNKMVYVNNGSILDVVLDIRNESKTYGETFSVKIDTNNPVLLYIPKGCAHGFLSLEDNTMVTYMQSSCYNGQCDMGIHYNSFGFDWGVNNPVMSERDKLFEPFPTFKSPF
jgi:dTDP-4-dehydrorhamnose 3,5-epimerase